MGKVQHLQSHGTQLTSGVTLSLSVGQTDSDIHVSRAGPVGGVQPNKREKCTNLNFEFSKQMKTVTDVK